MNKTIGLDIDGVVYNYHEALYSYFRTEKNYDKGYAEFWLKYIPSLSGDVQDYFISIPMIYEMIAPRTDILKILEKIANKAEIFYITSRSTDLALVTERYFRKGRFPYNHNLVFTNKKDIACLRNGITDFVDDFVSHFVSCSRVCNSYLMNKPWNLDAVVDNDKRVRSLDDFYIKVFGQ